ncbi:hypothetical protein SAMN05421640_0226 [Ekhidna lutea]|uniref:TLP18.3, Psb32 and MOLO-1 founding protein of phosphatase n=1 Tax=Ekhidna lutea TaxID=447679 RepID=A0A239EM46_EKHLU|nr:hypothetical protein [Ekhidna lutea]SNS45697.1 hypothetical protein SAMN05421640_0226 [Ekhidna lutea]
MRIFLLTIFALMASVLAGQSPIYDYVSFNKTLKIPKDLSRERTAVIFSVPHEKNNGYDMVGDHQKMLNQVHKGFVTMGIDAIFYLNDLNLTANKVALLSYVELFNKRGVKNVIFLTKQTMGYEFIMAPYDGTIRFIKDGSDVFYAEDTDLYDLLLKVGKEIRRADQELYNFLIPEKPNYLQGVSIVENTLLKNYPGILRRSKLAVERFSLLDTTNISDERVMENIRVYNNEIKRRNADLEKIMGSYPYEYEMINTMSDDELKRNRYQFLLRHVRSSAKNVKQMLDYEVLPSETDFVSVIPVMPDQTRVKTIPKDAIVYKFYVRQNISKNVHVGEWDADVTWQEALSNMIGNLTQELNIRN